jgi:hypothetical protein
MAHFARIEQRIVREVLFIHDDDCGGGHSSTSNQMGQAYIASIGVEGHWELTRADVMQGDRFNTSAVEKVEV